MEIDTSVPQSARIWNYWLGGTDNFPVDRAAGDEYRAVFPGIDEIARESRRYLSRAVRYLATEAGIRQFLDAGAGLPAADNTHQIAQRAAPEARVVYIDKDPYVVEHGRRMLAGSSGIYLQGDLQKPAEIVSLAAREFEMDRPVALILNGVLGHIPTTAEARDIVAQLMAGLPPGSYLSINDGVRTAEEEALNQAQDAYNESGAVPYLMRTPEEIASFFEGLDLVPPGVVPSWQWHPGPGDERAGVNQYSGVGRKPGPAR
ncbi:SAM-dependent methyltransferase [Actinoplanes aureus]|uniref:SAM-dependent methyltransferase n=1 Tax=Actinoplanes aureus TaxID=2792083 RepID=A0A931CA30_9ACTN|nr:SAM-dependent methyltransferase [Actinoplanes aureus]MBG0564934.1 SAM-dependent methyltransferase [Actinoplanes aureus]